MGEWVISSDSLGTCCVRATIVSSSTLGTLRMHGQVVFNDEVPHRHLQGPLDGAATPSTIGDTSRLTTQQALEDNARVHLHEIFE